MKKLILFFGILSSISGFAQPDAIYSQYTFNQFVINPAYAGSRNSISALLLHRSRWNGIQGAPATSTLSAHSRFGKSNWAWGGNIAADRLGATTNLLTAITGAYQLRMRTGKLAIGLRVGFLNSSINGSQLDFRDPTDELIISSRQGATVPTTDFGLYYFTRRLFVSLSLNHFTSPRFSYSALPDAEIYLKSFNTLGAGYAFGITDNIMLKPSFMLRQSDGFDVALDANLSALFYDRIWFGVSVRNQISINFLLEANITDFMRIGYTYDSFFNSLNSVSNGAHEFFVGFDFRRVNTKKTSTRYL